MSTVSTYLFERAKQLGVEHIFGVPGDFNLSVLEHIEMNTDLKWVGCCNELNSAYAADGYARVRKTPGFLVTTYGVGELSAINGIAGARSESVPIVHIVGMTGRPIQEQNMRIHHVQLGQEMGEPDHLLYTRIAKELSCCTEIITDISKAPQQIDNVIENVVKHSSPGYIFLPVDMFSRPCKVEQLEKPLKLQLGFDNDQKVVEKVANEIAQAIYNSKNPCILVDMLAERFLTRDQIKKFVEKTGLWAYTTILGKAAVDEDHDQYVGLYNGSGSAKGVAEAVHSSDLVLNLGIFISDSNTGGFTRQIKDENAVLMHTRYVTVKGNEYDGVCFVQVFEKLLDIIDTSKLPKMGEKPKVDNVPPHVEPHGENMLSETQLVDSLNKIVKPNDALLVETGTFQFASHDINLKYNSDYISQVFFSCIGYTLPAALGTAIAQRESTKGRTILVEGDGSAQMTIQELGTMVRQKLNPIIILINNEGYSIERAIFGPTRKFNDICPNWKWTKICEVFGGTDETVQNHHVTSKKQLDDLIPQLTEDKMHFIEVICGKYEYPWRLEKQVEGMGKYNMGLFKEYAEKHDNLEK